MIFSKGDFAMPIIDLHVDTLLLLQRRDNSGDLYTNQNTSLDIEKMKSGDYMAQFFAMYLEPEADMEKDNIERVSRHQLLENMIDSFYENLDANSSHIAYAGSYSDLIKNNEKGLISAFLTIEDGAIMGGSMDKIKYYYDKGVRLITLTWNFENCFGYPNSGDRNIMERGLKPFGKEAIEYMNELGIIVDVSHLSDGGFYDVLEISKKPFAASHSNARAVTAHQRNLTDDMIKKLANAGGVCGLNFCSSFLSDRDETHSHISDMVLHLNHLKNKGGEDFVALGSDYDGISNTVEVSGPHEMEKLFDALSKAKWTARQIDKLSHLNALRFIKDSL